MTRVFRMWEHQGWGDLIQWGWGADDPGRRVSGCLRDRPSVADLLHARRTDGSVAEWRFTSVEPMRNLADMFFADVEFVRIVAEGDQTSTEQRGDAA